jgi:hypothetical protein
MMKFIRLSLSGFLNRVVHKIFEGPSKLQNQLLLIPLFLSISLSAGLAQFISGGPQPGDIYKEFMLNLSQNNTSWRVTDPGATYVGEPGNSPSDFLPNPTHSFTIDDYSNVEKVELIIDLWGGHVGTTGKKIRFNSNDWIDIPELNTTPTDGQCYIQQLNYTIEIPTSHLATGSNTIQGTSGEQTCYNFNWGQWGWYGAVIRIYYNSDKGQTKGSISNIFSGDMLFENPIINIDVDGPINKIDVLGYYEYYDVDGDGYYKEWVGDYHRTFWSDDIDLNNHIGTITTAPYELTWDTKWVPDQIEDSIKIQARIQDENGYWYATDIIDNLSLYRTSYSVKLNKAGNVPEDFWVRNKETPKTSRIQGTVSGYNSAQMHVRTWNGRENTDSIYYLRLNSYEVSPSSYGREYFYDYDVISIPFTNLNADGSFNTVSIYSESAGHGLEVLWPGPALILKNGTQPSNIAPSIVRQPLNQNVILGESTTLSVNAVGSYPISYQWRLNGVDIPGANLAQYTTPELTFSDNGDVYSCYITNAYGDITSASAITNVIGSGVRITNATDEGIDCYKIETNLATYYYDKAGGGFISMVDNDGVDWISHNPTPGSEAAGEFRGFPNTGELHPGYTGGSSTTSDPLNDWRDFVTIQTTRNGEQATFTFYPNYVKMTLDAIGGSDNAYWILFEGTPGGAVGADDMVYLSNGTSFDANQDHPFGSNDIINNSGAAVGSEWMYITDGTQNRSVYLAITDDNVQDNYWQMQDNMVVFGSGREQGSVTQYRTDVGAEIIIGFVESKVQAVVENVIDATWTGNQSATLPSPPSDLSVTLNSPTELQLDWTDNADNENNFIIERKVNNGTYNVLDAVGTNVTTYTDGTVSAGNVYFYRVSSSNSSGQSIRSNEVFISIAPPTNYPEIDVWYGDTQRFGHLGNPQNWINILGNVSDSDGTINTLSYTLNFGSSVALSMGPDERRLQNNGDFNADIDAVDLADGINYLIITARDNGGNATNHVIEIIYNSGNTWNQSYEVDWDTVTNIQNVAQVVDGKWEYSASGIRTTESGYDRLIAIGDISWTDYEVTMPITVNSIDPPISPQGGDEFGIGLLMRWTGHTDSPVAGWQPKSGWIPNGEIGWFNWDEVGQTNPRISFLNGSISNPIGISLGVPYVFKFQVLTRINGDHRYNLKVWLQSDPEPSDWSLTFDSNSSNLANGSFLLIAHHVDATFGDISVSPVTISLPANPSDFIASQNSASQVTLTWTDNSFNEDNFIIQRRISGGTYTDLATLDSNVTSYIDAAVASGITYDYRIASENAFGESSYQELSILIETIPAAPSGLIATQVNATEVSLQWTDNSNNEDNFILQRRLSGGTFTDLATIDPDITTFSDVSITSDNTFEYRVYSENEAGQSGASNQVSIYIIPIPTAPSDLAATQINETEISLQWTDKSNNEDNFVLQRRLSGGTFTDLVTLNDNTEIYSDIAIEPDRIYEYRVRAENIGGASSYSNIVAINVVPIPTAPSGLTATEISETEVSLAWTDNSNNEDSFIIRRRVSGGTYSDIATVGEDVDTYLDNTVIPGTTYQYTVRAINIGGQSSNSNQVTIDVIPAPITPSGLTAEQLSVDEISLFWTDNSDNEDNFVLERSVNGGGFSTLVTLSTNNTTYLDASIAPGNNYEYRVKAINTYGESDYSSTVNLTALPAPEVPTGLTATQLTTTEVEINWTDNSDNEDNFVLERNTNGGGFSILITLSANISSYLDASVSPGNNYEYRIKALNTYGESDYSNTVNLTVLPAPDAPSGLSAIQLTTTEVDITWTDNSDNEDNFVLERSVNGGGFNTLITLWANSSTFSDFDVIPGNNYSYRIKAINTYGESDYSNIVNLTVFPAPNVPTGLTATQLTINEIDITWTDNSDNEDNFVLERSVNGGGFSTLVTLSTNNTTYLDASIASGNNYEYRVKAINTYGESDYSSIVNLTALPAPEVPTGLTATQLTTTEVEINWTDDSDNEDNFVLERNTNGGGFSILITLSANISSYLDASVSPGNNYEYRIKALNTYGESDYSNTVNLTVLPAPDAPSGLTANQLTTTEVDITWTDNSDNEDNFVLERSVNGGGFTTLINLWANSSSFSDFDVIPGNNYSYRIKATNTYGESDYSNIPNVLILPAPDEPTNLTAIQLTTKEVEINWTDNSIDEDIFILERSEEGANYLELAEIHMNTTNFTDLTVSPSTSYDYRIKAVNQYGESGYSNIASIFVLPAPQAPSDLFAEEVSETEVALDWTDNSDDEDKFVIERRLVGGDYEILITLSSNVTSYIDNSIEAGSSYEYRVYAENKYGKSPTSNQANIYVEPAPDAPTNLLVAQVTDIEVILSWSDNSDNEDHFILERRLVGASYAELVQMGPDQTEYSDLSVLSGNTYQYRLLASNLFGQSDYTNEVEIYVEPAPLSPTSLTVIQISESEVVLTWDDNSDNETQFIIERKTGDGEFIEVNSVESGIETFIDDSVTPENTYTYRVKAINDFAESAYTNEVSLTVLITGLEIINQEINIYPNPIRDLKRLYLSLQKPISGDLEFIILDINGSIIKSKKMTIIAESNLVEMNLSDLIDAQGVYILNIRNKNGFNEVYKLIYQ